MQYSIFLRFSVNRERAVEWLFPFPSLSHFPEIHRM